MTFHRTSHLMAETLARKCSVDGCIKPSRRRGWCGAHYDRWLHHGDPLAGRTPVGEALSYYHEIVLAYEGDECLIWPYAKNDSGYGVVYVDGVPERVHRLACESENGPSPTSRHQAAHSCGKGHLACVTKRHLSWKTNTENQADRLAHGTSNRGSRHGSSKITEADVLRARSLMGKMSGKQIADLLGISRKSVSDIHKRRTWAWLEEAPQ